jgi:hypothetical protein
MATKKTATKGAAGKTTKKAIPAKKGSKANPVGPAKARTRNPSPTDDSTRAALQKLGGPSAISKIAEAMGVATVTARKALKRLGDAVKSEGTTRDRKYSLA